MKINTAKILAACLLMISASAWAVPARRVKKTVTLTDGTKKEVTLVGDENMHFYTDADGNAYITGPDGLYVRKDRSILTGQWQERLAKRNKHRIERAKARGMNLSPKTLSQNGGRHRAQWGAEQNPIEGSKKGLVILVNFSDLAMNKAHDQKFYDGFFNEVGFNKGGNSGSVHDYFFECSYTNFDLTFDVYGPVTVSKPYSYYGQNNSNNYDMYPGELTAEACNLVDKLGADFSKYDWDGDGEVDQVYLIYAGYGEHADAPDNTIWPHECTLSEEKTYGDGSGPITLDGVKVDTYAMSSELDGNSGNEPAGIGTACHEFSHCMCLPDFYDTSGEGRYGMDEWDLMDYGSYSGPNSGGCPVPYTCYERMYCGWLTPTVLSNPCLVRDMKSLYEAPEAYIIYNDKNPNEYYMLANYQQKGFGAYYPAHGMLVLHVYFDSEVWTNNTVNSTSWQHMTIIPADGRLTGETNSADTWPGKSKKTALTDTSTPAAELHDGSYLGKPISEIEESDKGKITFLFNGGIPLDMPVVTDPTNVTKDGFTANWAAVEGATDYKVLLTAADKEAQQHSLDEITLLKEDFSGFNNGKANDGSTDLSESLDDYTKMPGWTGDKLYTTPNDEVKMSTSKKSGGIYAPWLTAQNSKVTLDFTVRRYGNDSAPLLVRFGEGSDVVGYNLDEEIELTDQPVRHVITIPVEENDFWWGLECEKRCYISEMSTYDGEVTAEQIDAGVVNVSFSETTYVTTEGNSYQFTGLSPKYNYTYSVRAISNDGYSEWSNEVNVTLSNETRIKSLTPTLSKGEGAVYDLSGRQLVNSSTCQLVNSLKKGLYIINGKKVVR